MPRSIAVQEMLAPSSDQSGNCGVSPARWSLLTPPEKEWSKAKV